MDLEEVRGGPWRLSHAREGRCQPEGQLGVIPALAAPYAVLMLRARGA